MRLAGWPILAGLIAAILIPNTLWAQAPKPSHAMSLQVQVRLEDGTAPPRGSLCELDLQNGEPIDQSETDSSGKCRFVPSEHVIYIVRVKAAGYQEIAQRVDLQNSQTGLASMVLRPIPGQTPPVASKDAPGATVSAIDLSVPESARKEFDLGQQSLQKHNLDAGITHIKKAIELHEQFPQAYAMLRTAYNEQKKWKDAQGALEKALQQDPKAVEAYFQLGASLNQQKDYAGAVKALNQGLQLNQDAPDAGCSPLRACQSLYGVRPVAGCQPARRQGRGHAARCCFVAHSDGEHQPEEGRRPGRHQRVPGLFEAGP